TLTVGIPGQQNLPGAPETVWAEAFVADTGKGIPEEIKSRIFEPFFSTKEEGIGLGLPIAQRIIEEHGGKIRVESHLGKGTLFRILLPLHPGRKQPEKIG
ncbi:MAG: ATP-binding protein, partial [Deltaproteobacteria bacterium]|nr:ATP-binding protein [Deltaproteobacteria bacterium]